MKKILNEIKNVLPKKTETRIFLFSFFFLLFITILVTYNFKMDTNFNLLFDSDTARVIGDATEIAAEHYRINVHPLFIILVQPIVFLLKGIVLNKSLAISIVSALVSSLSVLYIYRILEIINKNKKENIILSLIYCFSFSNMIFTAGVETYNFASLFLIIMWYYFIQKKDKYNIYSYIILTVLGILSFAFTLTNCINFCILLFILLISKKVKLKELIIIGLCSIIGVLSLNITQKIVWNNTPFMWKTNVISEGNDFSVKTLGLNNIINVGKYDYYNSLISEDVKMTISYGSKYNSQNYVIAFNHINYLNLIVITIFYLISLFFIIRNFKKNKLLNLGLLLSLGFNTALHLFYGNNGAFLYSLHFLYLIILLFGINLSNEENKTYKKYAYYFLYIFFLIEFITNNIIFVKILLFIKETLSTNYLLANFGLLFTPLIELMIMLLVTIIIFFGIWLVKKIKKVKKKEEKIVYGLLLFLSFLAIQCIFISIESAPSTDRLWIFRTKGYSGEVSAKGKEYYLEKEFKEYFKEDLEKLSEYQEEYNEWLKEHEYELTDRINGSDYYYFGFGNRKKYGYFKNRLIELDTKKEIKTFDEKDHIMIPNEYEVLIETKDNHFIKIKEDKDGVHYIEDGKETILEGTDLEINLFDFSNQKYSNMKKVLYGEILFNIKDNVIYPNIVVYDKPWYRDAALACMVLKQTNNTDLIKDWVLNITEIYDKQNDGIEEADNLGELLYILSTQEEKNYDLIRRIEEEAERIASSNEDGYYLKGKTDFGDMYLYQNLWYKLGIESIGKTFKFDLSSIPEDSYASMAWWSNYNVKDEVHMKSEEFPYLTYATRHNNGKGIVVMNSSLYPLSWEITASQAKYDNYKEFDARMSDACISPLHTWAASELLLWMLDETNDLIFQ